MLKNAETAFRSPYSVTDVRLDSTMELAEELTSGLKNSRRGRSSSREIEVLIQPLMFCLITVTRGVSKSHFHLSLNIFFVLLFSKLVKKHGIVSYNTLIAKKLMKASHRIM